MLEQKEGEVLKIIEKCVENLEHVIYFIERQEQYIAEQYNAMFLSGVSELLEKSAGREIMLQLSSLDELLEILKSAQTAQIRRNYIFLKDIYELQLLPVLTLSIEYIVGKQGVSLDMEMIWQNFRTIFEKDSDILAELFKEACFETIPDKLDEFLAYSDYFTALLEEIFASGMFVEYTSSGKYTLAAEEDGTKHYFHTNGRISREAMVLADEWLAQRKDDYFFYGLGLGYPYQEMLQRDENVSVTVLESNKDLFVLALCFSPLYEMFETGRFHLHYDGGMDRMRRTRFYIGDTQGFYLFYPALLGIKDYELRQKMEQYFVEESSVRIQGEKLNRNFRRNMKSEYLSINTLREELVGKCVIIAAGGPSLDKNMHLLKERQENIKLIAVGTVLKKFLAKDIIPDYTIIIDAKSGTYRQIDGIEECGVPLIFLSTVYAGIPESYSGRKYLLCQEDFQPAEQLAEQEHWIVIESGGSVTTAAFDLCLRCAVRNIIFVGLDLAYTDGMNHASDTADFDAVDSRHTDIRVEGIHGEMLPTAKNLNIYKEWLENRIRRRSDIEKEIDIVDATEGGAKIEGMIIRSLQEALEVNT